MNNVRCAYRKHSKFDRKLSESGTDMSNRKYTSWYSVYYITTEDPLFTQDSTQYKVVEKPDFNKKKTAQQSCKAGCNQLWSPSLMVKPVILVEIRVT